MCNDDWFDDWLRRRVTNTQAGLKVCPTCQGDKNVVVTDHRGRQEIERCPECGGEGFIRESEEVSNGTQR